MAYNQSMSRSFGFDAARRLKGRAERAAEVMGLSAGGDDKILSSLKDRHKDESIFIVGNGPSVDLADLDRMDGRIIIALNRFHLAYPLTRLRPAYTVAAGAKMLALHGGQIADLCQTLLVTPRSEKALTGGLGDVAGVRTGEDGFQTNFLKRPDGASGAPGLAVQLAVWLGAARIVLYGFDHGYVVSPDALWEGDTVRSMGERNHFIADYRAAGEWWTPPDLDAFSRTVRHAVRWGEESNVAVVNASRGGALTAAPRATLMDEISAAGESTKMFFRP